MDIGCVPVVGCSVVLCVMVVCVAALVVPAGVVLACTVVSCTIVGRAPVVSEYLASFLPDRHPPGLFSEGKYSSLSQSS